MKPKQNYAHGLAAILDVMRKLTEIIYNNQTELSAMHRALEEADPSFKERYEKYFAAVTEEIADAKDSALHLMERTAGQLRGDPYWAD